MTLVTTCFFQATILHIGCRTQRTTCAYHPSYKSGLKGQGQGIASFCRLRGASLGLTMAIFCFSASGPYQPSPTASFKLNCFFKNAMYKYSHVQLLGLGFPHRSLRGNYTTPNNNLNFRDAEVMRRMGVCREDYH